MNSRVKNILIPLLLFALLGASLGYYLLNKGPLDIRDSNSIKTNATALYEQFSADSSLALKKYSGKVLQVTGEVNSVSPNQKKEKVILLRTITGGAFINCTLEEDPGNINTNDRIILKGICSGIGQGDKELGIKGDVYLTRCLLIK